MRKRWKESRYGLYYQKAIGKKVDMPISDKKMYAEYYRKIYIYPQYDKEWKRYLKRINILKKNIESIGKIPPEESNLINSIKYFTRLVRIVTEFRDEGILNIYPADKVSTVQKFNKTIIMIVCRESSVTITWKEPYTGQEKIAQYWNMSKEKEIVNYNNLYLGMFSEIMTKISQEASGLTARINNNRYNIDTIMSPVSHWLSNMIKEPKRNDLKLRREAFSIANRKIVESLLKLIEEMLEA